MKKIVLLIGASSDIGISIINELDEKEYKFVLLVRNKIKMEENLKNCKKDFIILETNFSEIEIKKEIVEIIQKENKIDICINCLGIGIFKDGLSSQLIDLEESLRINFLYPVIIFKEVIKYMKIENDGIIINMDSIASNKGFAYGSNYCSSKFALKGYFECIKEELLNTKIRIVSIKPGLINTKFFKNLTIEEKSKLQNALQTKDISNIIKMICLQSEYSNISEVIIRPNKVETKKLFYDLIKPKEEKSNE